MMGLPAPTCGRRGAVPGSAAPSRFPSRPCPTMSRFSRECSWLALQPQRRIGREAGNQQDDDHCQTGPDGSFFEVIAMHEAAMTTRSSSSLSSTGHRVVEPVWPALCLISKVSHGGQPKWNRVIQIGTSKT
jgi:hypothetical protein